MADDLSKSGTADATRVNVNKPDEPRFLTTKWGVSARHLEAAVKKVGVITTDVARELRK